MKKHHLWGWTTAILSFACIIALLFIIPQYEPQLTAFAIKHPLVAPLLIILFRIIAMVVPPIPGGILSFALIPVLGWFWSYVYAVIGITIGATIAFFIARKFREPVVSKFVPLQELNTWEKHLSGKTEFFAFLLLRLTTGPIADFVSYVAGLTNISYRKFLIVTLIAEIPSLPVYYFGARAYKHLLEHNDSYIGLIFLLVLGVVVYIFKDHKFFKKAHKKS